MPIDKDPDIIDYYHRLPESYYLFVYLREYGLFRDEHADFTDEMKRQRKLRGKTYAYPGFKPNPDRPTKFSSLQLSLAVKGKKLEDVKAKEIQSEDVKAKEKQS